MESPGAESALPADPAGRVEAILNEIADYMGLDADVVVDESDEEISARFDGDDLGLVIGRRGLTIDAMQLICYRAAFRDKSDRKRVSVDAAGYRAERSEIVERQADRAAERAVESGKEIELEAMSSTERRIVHQHLKGRAGIETFSEGTEPERCVVVAPLVGSDESEGFSPESSV
jgi:spoIIIJ-associated protein